MSIQYLNSIVYVLHEAINQSKKEEDRSIDKWSPILKPWSYTLSEACNELNSFRPYRAIKFQSLKRSLVDEWKKLLLQIQNETAFNSNYVTIEDAYEEIEDKIDKNMPLSTQDILLVLYFGLTMLIERSVTDDYSEFYDLITINDAIKEYENGLVVSDLNKESLSTGGDVLKLSTLSENESVKEASPLSRYAWLCLINREEVSTRTYKALVKKYNIPIERSYVAFRNEYKYASKLRIMLKSGNVLQIESLPKKTRGLIMSCLVYVQTYFENSSNEKKLIEIKELISVFED